MNRVSAVIVVSLIFGLAGSAIGGFFLSRAWMFPLPPLVATTPIAPSDPTQLIGVVLTAEQNMVQATQNLITFFAMLLAGLTIAGGFVAYRANQIAQRAADTARKAAHDAEVAIAEAKNFRAELEAASDELSRTKTRSLHDIEFLRRQVLHLGIAESVQIITTRNYNQDERLRELLELAQMLNPAAIRVFQFILEYEQDPAFVTNAAYGLMQLGLLARGPYIQGLLMRHAEASNANIRVSCAECLGEVSMAEDDAVMQKLQQLAETDRDPAVRAAAAEALGHIAQRG